MVSKYVEIEGADRVGKTTQLTRVAKAIGGVTERFPSPAEPATYHAIRQQLKDGITDPLSFQALQLTNRVIVQARWADDPRPRICDRGLLSFIVYGMHDCLDRDFIMAAVRTFAPPVCSVVLRLDSAELERRLTDTPDREAYEVGSIPHRIGQLYGLLDEAHIGWPIYRIDASGTPEQVTARIVDRIGGLL